ncbi:MAG: hypothetical protein ACJA06_002053 [Halocynthiibacter sp.]|jgi:hypothetical protein
MGFSQKIGARRNARAKFSAGLSTREAETAHHPKFKSPQLGSSF